MHQFRSFLRSASSTQLGGSPRSTVTYGQHSSYRMPLIFVGFIFRGFAILRGFHVLKFAVAENSGVTIFVGERNIRIYGVSPYTIIVYDSCRGAKRAGLDFQRHTWRSWLSGSL